MSTSMPPALTIAGSDPCGGAGLQADLKVFHQHRCYGMGVVTCITVQDTRQVREVRPVPGDLVAAQIETAVRDIPARAAKVGALGSRDVVEAVSRWIRSAGCPVVVDPVREATGGFPLLDEEGWTCLKDELLPHATLVTPNVREASLLTGVADVREAARAIADLGARAVLVTGVEMSEDLLYTEGRFHAFRESAVAGTPAHGTGCALSAAIAARLAWGETVLAAVAGAKRYVTEAIRCRPGLGEDSRTPGFHAGVDGGILEGEPGGGSK